MQKKQLITRKPAYRHGQLLLEDDFIDEQQYHWHARCRHARNLHGFGVARGLEVTAAGDMAVAVSPGYAVDRKGREIELAQPETLELAGLPAGALAWVTIGYRSESPGPDGGDVRIDCYAVLRVATGVEPFDVRLARVQLDERGRLAADAIHAAERDALRSIIAPGSVTAEALDAPLRRGWVTMAFHPSRIPQDDPEARPPFRIGATQAQAHKVYNGQPNTRGAAGTMAIVLPPGIRRLHRFRIAGAANEQPTRAVLIKGGLDLKARKHVRDEIATLDVPGGQGAYCETTAVAEPHRDMDGQRTLAVDVRAEGYLKVSLVGVEVSY